MENTEQNIRIITLPPEMWELYKQLRLEALAEEPQAFGQSYEEALHQSDSIWKDKLIAAQQRNTFWMLFALDGLMPVGLVSAKQETNEKFRHIVEIHSVYVKSRYRRMGIAGKIFESLLGEIQNQSHIRKIKLTVNVHQTAAIKLYEHFGFRIVGKAERELNIHGRFEDEYYMEKLLGSAFPEMKIKIKALTFSKKVKISTDTLDADFASLAHTDYMK